jgi:hypothetical protein
MPLVQVDLDEKLFSSLHEPLSRAIHQAQIDALGIPADDLFQVFYPHATGELKFDPGYNGVDRQNLLVVRMTMVRMYSSETKNKLYAAIVARLGQCGIRAEDVLISIVENGYEDWYAGRTSEVPASEDHL